MTEAPARRGALQWLDTDAGHAMLLPARLLPLWSGAESPRDGREIEASFRCNPTGPATDYDRACSIDDIVGILSVGDGAGIVLGQEPMPTTWLPLPHGGGLLAQLYTCELGDYPDRLPALPPDLVWHRVGTFETDGSPLVLFDTTEVGAEPPVFPTITVPLAQGGYVVERTTFGHPEMELWLVRLCPKGAPDLAAVSTPV